jgi:hypothetical protein
MCGPTLRPSSFTKWSYFYKYFSIAFAILPGGAGGLALELFIATFPRQWKIILITLIFLNIGTPGRIQTFNRCGISKPVPSDHISAKAEGSGLIFKSGCQF